MICGLLSEPYLLISPGHSEWGDWDKPCARASVRASEQEAKVSEGGRKKIMTAFPLYTFLLWPSDNGG